MNKQLLAVYGLKWNPFSPELPTEALRLTPALQDFAWRLEHSLVREGGFALISGDVGTGKSVALRLLAERLAPLPDLTVAALAHPSASLADLPVFDLAEHLDSDQAIAEYLTAVLDENDAGELAHALGVIARARGMTEIAEASGLGREALYKALRPDAQPRFDTIVRVCAALGVRLVARPATR